MLLFNKLSIENKYLSIEISIHLMLLFNGFLALMNAAPSDNFNTSNVTIQPLFLYSRFINSLNFNTSNVTIQQYCLHHLLHTLPISIHLMLLFNSGKSSVTVL